MGPRAQALLETEVGELREEVDELRAEARRLHKELRDLRSLVAVSADSRSADRASVDSGEDSYSGSRGHLERSPGQSSPAAPVFDRAPSVAESNGPVTPSNQGLD